jgi:hypothetical protein
MQGLPACQCSPDVVRRLGKFRHSHSPQSSSWGIHTEWRVHCIGRRKWADVSKVGLALLFRTCFFFSLAYSSTLRKQHFFSEISVDFQRTTRRYILGDKSFYNHRCWESQVVQNICWEKHRREVATWRDRGIDGSILLKCILRRTIQF